MQSQYGQPPWQTTLSVVARFLGRNLPAVAFLILATGGMVAAYLFFNPAETSAGTMAVNVSSSYSAAITKPLPAKPVLQRLVQSPPPLRIGLISGHQGSDPGAVCDDGLTEAEVNLTITEMVAEQLRAQNIPVDILDEFDPRLDNYVATALISIHADSCVFYTDFTTGYKIAATSRTDSQKLYTCMESSYAAATDLDFHANTITPHMTDYHAFRKIAPGTPAIILETGFMNQDRPLLTETPERPSTGIVDGILCFLDR